jgi:DNA-binding transcriptional regulator YiaG
MFKRHNSDKKLEIAKKLIEYRKKNNLSQEELARLVNSSVYSISRWETAKHYPTSSAIKLMKIAGVL